MATGKGGRGERVNRAEGRAKGKERDGGGMETRAVSDLAKS
jgi:hypothetical protein